MRRLYIQGYVFLPCFLSLSILLHPLCSSCPPTHSRPLLYTLLALEGPGKTWHKQLLSNYQRRNTLYMYVSMCIHARLQKIAQDMNVNASVGLWIIEVQMGILDLNYSLYLCVSFTCLRLTLDAKLLSPLQTSMCLIVVSPSLSLLPIFFFLTHACSLHSPLGIFLLNNQFLSWLMWLGHTHTHTQTHILAHTQTLPWDWIDTPLCSAEGGIDIIPGHRPNTLLSFTKRGRRGEGGEGAQAVRKPEKEGHRLHSANS